MEKYDEALKMCSEARKLDDKDFMICNEIAIINTYLHDYNEAKFSFEAAEKLISNDNERRIFKNNIGWMYLCFREISKAKEILQELINDEKAYHQAINLGHCYLLENNEDEAIKLYLICIKNATTEEIFWKSFDSDYKAIRMDKLGITEKMYNDLKAKIISKVAT